jgi:hypothetical protein
MRSVCVLVIACLVAAAGVRPLTVEHRDPRASHIAAAPAALVVLARRDAPHAPEQRLSPCVLVATPVIAAPVAMASDDVRPLATRIAACALETPCARGPPIA